MEILKSCEKKLKKWLYLSGTKRVRVLDSCLIFTDALILSFEAKMSGKREYFRWWPKMIIQSCHGNPSNTQFQKLQNGFVWAFFNKQLSFYCIWQPYYVFCLRKFCARITILDFKNCVFSLEKLIIFSGVFFCVEWAILSTAYFRSTMRATGLWVTFILTLPHEIIALIKQFQIDTK